MLPTLNTPLNSKVGAVGEGGGCRKARSCGLCAGVSCLPSGSAVPVLTHTYFRSSLPLTLLAAHSHLRSTLLLLLRSRSRCLARCATCWMRCAASAPRSCGCAWCDGATPWSRPSTPHWWRTAARRWAGQEGQQGLWQAGQGRARGAACSGPWSRSSPTSSPKGNRPPPPHTHTHPTPPHTPPHPHPPPPTPVWHVVRGVPLLSAPPDSEQAGVRRLTTDGNDLRCRRTNTRWLRRG